MCNFARLDFSILFFNSSEIKKKGKIFITFDFLKKDGVEKIQYGGIVSLFKLILEHKLRL